MMYTCKVIKFLVIIFYEKVYDVKVFCIVLSYLKFHDFRQVKGQRGRI